MERKSTVWVVGLLLNLLLADPVKEVVGNMESTRKRLITTSTTQHTKAWCLSINDLQQISLLTVAILYSKQYHPRQGICKIISRPRLPSTPLQVLCHSPRGTQSLQLRLRAPF